MRYFDGITETRKAELFKQLRAVWTHDSTAIEGNTLTLGDTMFVLEYGLTIKGKPLKDQRDIQNHAAAIDHLLKLVTKDVLTEDDLFDLHRLVINEQTLDIYKPVGAYKREDNGTYRATSEGKSVYHAYVAADETPAAMRRWLADFNAALEESAMASEERLVELYARLHQGFTSIHPFFDGNGRLARLLANLPILRAGCPPIVIPVERRADYLAAIWAAEDPAQGLKPLEKLLAESWQTTLDLVIAAKGT